ncbi:MAG: cell division protein SepF [Eubacteriales bacterium]|nr:cell division protein SepF [Eubacteriales bacterium]MDY4898184.1 cell division protein SepF [Eubacteriales bacterium]
MNFFKKLLKDEDELYDDKFKDDYTQDTGGSGDMIDDIPPADSTEQHEVSIAKTPGMSLRVMRPKSYDDGPEIADYVARGCTVVMNIEDLNRENARRLIDFLLGAVHVIGGDLQMASQTTFVVAPCRVGMGDAAESDDGTAGFTFK